NNHEDIINAAAVYKIPPEKIIVKFGKRHEVPALLSLSTYSLFFIKACYSNSFGIQFVLNYCVKYTFNNANSII
ncbi:MAG TPA: hypothetical protein PLV98_08925, partial [Dysgonamonadaceae bacterium]|nr:hypothetical protein [Dysgonamonadaceae bacterium]